MGLAPECKLVVKHTFLEYVGDENAAPIPKQMTESRQRSYTEPDVFANPFYDELREHYHGSDTASSSSSSSQPKALQSDFDFAQLANLQLSALVTPEGTPLQGPSNVRQSTLWSPQEWDLSLPEAYGEQLQGMEHYNPWLDQCAYEDWWSLMPHDSEMSAAIDCYELYNQQLLTMCDQYQANGTAMEQAYMVLDQSATEATVPALAAVDEHKETRTTVMIRDLPDHFTRLSLLKLLDAQGFFGRFDFLYLPVDFKHNKNLGYALINLVSPSEALRFTKHFNGFSKWDTPSDRVCSVGWCSPQQGLQAHVERYRNSPVMHESVPEEWRPLLLSHGVPIPFPPPTQKVKAPKVKGMSS
jgi:hypothetical protein